MLTLFYMIIEIHKEDRKPALEILFGLIQLLQIKADLSRIFFLLAS